MPLNEEQRHTKTVQLEELAQWRIKMDRMLAQTAHECGDDPIIAEYIQAIGGYKAQVWARALKWYGSEWSDVDAWHNLSLLLICSAPSKKAKIMHERWEKEHLSYSELRALKAELTKRKPRVAKEDSLAQKVAGKVGDWRKYIHADTYSATKAVNDCADELAALPEVKRILEAK